MAKKKRSEYTRQRERITKVYKRIEERGYKPIEPLKLKTTKELLKEGTDPEEYAKFLAKQKTKDIKKGLQVYDPETGVIFNYDEVKEYEKEKNSDNNTASFYDWLKEKLDSIMLPGGLPYLANKSWIDGSVIENQFARFAETLVNNIDKSAKIDSIPEETKQEITEEFNKIETVPYFEVFQDSIANLMRLVLNRVFTPEESQFISDWSDYRNGGSAI